MKIKSLIIIASLFLLASFSRAQTPKSGVWSAEKANAWYAQHKWINGANFTPSTAINQLEMWQADTFDPQIIDRELGYAENIGFKPGEPYNVQESTSESVKMLSATAKDVGTWLIGGVSCYASYIQAPLNTAFRIDPRT